MNERDDRHNVERARHDRSSYGYQRPLSALTPPPMRADVLERDGHACQWRRMRLWGTPLPMKRAYMICTGPLDVHHRDRLEDGGENVPENLITLCRGHHARCHWAMRRENEAHAEAQRRHEPVLERSAVTFTSADDLAPVPPWLIHAVARTARRAARSRESDHGAKGSSDS